MLNELNKLLEIQLNGKKNINETKVKDEIKMDKNSSDNRINSKLNTIQINVDDRKIISPKKEKKKTKFKRKKKQILKTKIEINNPIRRKSQIIIENSKINEGEGTSSSHIGMKPIKTTNKIKKVNTEISIFKNRKKNKKDINLNDYELNNLPYIQALELDKRTFIDYYISLIKTKQLLIFTFYTKNDYNSSIIKICLFLFCFASYFIVNALFFNDSTMHKIYEDQGKYDLIYQIILL